MATWDYSQNVYNECILFHEIESMKGSQMKNPENIKALVGDIDIYLFDQLLHGSFFN
jgi:hypothetical protein